VTQDEACETWVAVGTEILIFAEQVGWRGTDGDWAREIASNTKYEVLWENDQKCLTYKKHHFSNISKTEPSRNQMPGVDAPVGMPLCNFVHMVRVNPKSCSKLTASLKSRKPWLFGGVPTVMDKIFKPWEPQNIEPPHHKSQCFRARVCQSDVGGFDIYRPLPLMHRKLH
jgi:hypothetical protein